MAYTINRYDATLLVSLTNNTLDTTSTSLTLVGEDYVGYGEQINENYVHLLENFRGTTAPTNPLEGQIWYDNNTNILKFYNGTTWDTLSDITHNHTLDGLSNVTITTNATGEILKWNGSAWINNTLAEAGVSATGHTHVATDVTDFDTEVSNNTSVVANTAKVTNATHTGDVTGDTALTIAANVVGANELNVTGNGTATQYLRSDGDGTFTWDTPAGGGASVTVATSPPGSPTEGDLYWDEDNGRMYIYYTDADSSQWVDSSPPVAGQWLETGNNLYSNNSASVLIADGGSTFLTVAENTTTGVMFDAGTMISANGITSPNVYLNKIGATNGEYIRFTRNGVDIGSIDSTGTDVTFSGTVAKWTTGRTITLTGDVTGVSAAFDGSGNLSFATALAANTVTSSELSGATSLLIINSAGTTLKTIYGAGS